VSKTTSDARSMAASVRPAIALGLSLCACLLAPPSASALEHNFLETFGEANQPSFTEAEGLAVDQSTGDLLVIDAGNRGEGEGTVSRWNLDGTPDNFSALGTNVIDGDEGGADETPEKGLRFNFPEEVQVAVDNSGGATDGRIYVTQATAGVVDVFASDGSFIEQLTESSQGAFNEPCGVGVDPAGNVYVGDFSGKIHKFANPPVDGSSVDFPFAINCTLAAGAGATNGFIFPAHLIGSTAKLDSTIGEEKYVVDPGPATTVTVDPGTGNVYVAAGSEVREYDASGASSVPLAPIAPGGEQVTGVAVDEDTGNVYVARKGNPNIEVWGPAVLLPEATTEAASVVAGTVTLKGVVSAGEGPEVTSCVFEYVEVSANGFEGAETVDCAPAAPFMGPTKFPVSAKITGLPEAAFRYRLVASSENGPAAGKTLFFNTFGETGLPDGRAYEMVSPSQKLGEVFPLEPAGEPPVLGTCGECLPGINSQMMPMQVAPDGESVIYEGQPFSGGLAAGPNQYISNRASTGWGTQSLSPPTFGSGHGQGYMGFSPDLSRGVLYQIDPALSPQAPTRANKAFANLYLRDESGFLQPLVTEEPPHRDSGLPTAGQNEFSIHYAGANAGTALSPAFEHLIFEANDTLTEEVPGVAPAAPEVEAGELCGSLGADCNLYEGVGGDLRLINVLPNENAASDAVIGSGRLLVPTPVFEAPVVDAAISDDGSRIFWNTEETGQLYVRINGEETLEVPGPGTCKESELLKDRACFLTASSDGSRVLLSDGQLFELNEGTEAYELSANLTGGQGGFQGILGASEDLSHVYFVDTKALTGEGEENQNGEHAEEGALNLYNWEEGATTFIGRLRSGADNTVGLNGRYGAWKAARPNRTSQVTPDGRYLAFMSRAPLTGVDDDIFQVFEYDADEETLVCASCNPLGQEPLGPSNLSVIKGDIAFPPLPQPNNLSPAGEGRLFFESQDVLSPRDTNGHIQDVYEWEPDGVGSCNRVGGCVYLISSGNHPNDSKFFNSTPSGNDAFFITRARLVAGDVDELLDLYDARAPHVPEEKVGFDEVKPAPCAGETCAGPATPPPAVPSAGSLDFSGPGNPPKSKPSCKRRSQKKRGRCVKRKHKKNRSSKRGRGGSR
jgi:hypothetical protein